MIQGVDISNLQGQPAVYRGESWYQAAEFVISQAIPRGPGVCADQLQAALDDGKHRGIYTWLWHDPTWRLSPDVAEDQRLRLAAAGDVPCDGRPWLDIEDNQSTGWQNVTVEERRSEVRIALAVLQAWADARGLPQPGVYSSDYFRDLLYGGDWDWLPAGTVLWLAHYGITPGSLIGGNVVGHQYSSTPIDSDMFLESEFMDPQPAPDYRTALADVTASDGEIVPALLAVVNTPRLLVKSRASLQAVVDRLGAIHGEFLA